MPIGTTLSNLRKMLNAEMGNVLDETVAPGSVDIDNQILNDQQAFLVNQHAFLLQKARAEVALTLGTQYYNFPSTQLDIDRVERPAYVRIGNQFRYRVEFGIGQQEYNAFDSGRGIMGTPVRRWDLVIVNSARKIEVWPIPSADQTLMLAGTLPLTAMVSDSDTCVIDDMLLVLFSAAEKLTRQGQPDAPAKLAKATAYLNSLKASAPSRFDTFNMSGAGRHFEEDYKRPVVGVTLTAA
jgi:hypothetical protein